MGWLRVGVRVESLASMRVGLVVAVSADEALVLFDGVDTNMLCAVEGLIPEDLQVGVGPEDVEQAQQDTHAALLRVMRRDV